MGNSNQSNLENVERIRDKRGWSGYFGVEGKQHVLLRLCTSTPMKTARIRGGGQHTCPPDHDLGGGGGGHVPLPPPPPCVRPCCPKKSCTLHFISPAPHTITHLVDPHGHNTESTRESYNASLINAINVHSCINC